MRSLTLLHRWQRCRTRLLRLEENPFANKRPGEVWAEGGGSNFPRSIQVLWQSFELTLPNLYFFLHKNQSWSTYESNWWIQSHHHQDPSIYCFNREGQSPIRKLGPTNHFLFYNIGYRENRERSGESDSGQNRRRGAAGILAGKVCNNGGGSHGGYGALQFNQESTCCYAAKKQIAEQKNTKL